MTPPSPTRRRAWLPALRLSFFIALGVLIAWIEAGAVKVPATVGLALLALHSLWPSVTQVPQRPRPVRPADPAPDDDSEPEPGGPDRAPRPPRRSWPHRIRPRVETAARPVIGLLTGAAVVVSGATLASWGQTRLSACPPPTELRVMTASETVRAVQETADAFADYRAAGGGCRPVRVTVFAAPAMRDLRDAFERGWINPAPGRLSSALSAIGPRPDVWLSSSSGTVGYALAGPPAGATVSADPRPVATTPMVLAALPAADTRLRRESLESITWDGLIGELRRQGVEVLRPNPETSDAGLVASIGLYGGHLSGSLTDQRERHLREQWASPAGSPATDARSVLCHLREQSAAQPDLAMAAIVPEQSLNDYNVGAPLGGDCDQWVARAGSGAGVANTLIAHYPGDTKMLDHAFVRIRWQHEHDPRRDRMAEAFRDWLGTDRLVEEGFRDDRGGPGDQTLGRLWNDDGVRQSATRAPPVSARELRETRDRVAAARAPVTMLFALDLSSTMNAPVTGGTPLGLARDMTDDALELLGEADRAGLWVFPGGSRGRAPRRLVKPARGRALAIREHLNGSLRADGQITPLLNTILTGARSLRGEPGGTLVVATDGEDDDPGHRDVAGAVRTELRAPDGPQVFVVVLAERGCGPLKSLDDSLPRLRCLDLTRFPDRQALLTDLFTRAWKG
ncbi:substrate-binding domain-containing protein [Actinomadura alba]|uniref:substrate-binding domain-containing protein n=1 Tax=Actinomadura alba TaxID=406431 RepID=UPI0031CFDAA3